MTQLLANVRPESKYAGQAKEQPFPVYFEPDICGYHWKGGVGGQYRTSDLFFLTLSKKQCEAQKLREKTEADLCGYFDDMVDV